MSTVQFVVALREVDLGQLNHISSAFAAEEKEWLELRRRAHKGLRAGELARARAKLRAELAQERAAGRLLGSRDRLRAQARGAELESRRGPGKHPAPATGASGPGRPWGADPDRYLMEHGEGEEAGFKGRLATRLPAALGEQLRRACYWNNKEAVEQLQAWADRFGDGPEVILREAERANDGGIPGTALLAAALSKRPDAAAFQERRRLRDQIVTTGDVLRSAVTRILDTYTAPVQTEIPI